MGEVLGVGLTHFPLLLGRPESFSVILKRTIPSPYVPEHMKKPESWPEPMQEEWANEMVCAVQHQEQLVENFRALRKEIDAFGPDAIVIFGDDQYENYKEDCVPPFCVYLHDQMESRPHTKGPFGGADNVWGEPVDKVFEHRGNKKVAKHLAHELIERGFPVAYSFTNGHFGERYGPTMLTHAFLNALLFLDWDRQGFEHPVIPIQVNSYSSGLINSRGGTAHLNPSTKQEPYGAEVAPPGPTPATCFQFGKLIRGILEETPGKYVIMASSSWSHAFLTAKHYWLYPDMETNRAHVAQLRAGQQERWAKLTTDDVDDAGDQEFRTWICLAGAMADRQAEVRDYLESYIFNSNKCFALFRPNAAGAR